MIYAFACRYSRCLSFPHPRHCQCPFLFHLAPPRLRLSLPRRGLSPPAPRYPLAVQEEALVFMPHTVSRRRFGLSSSLLPNRLRFPPHFPNRLRLCQPSPSRPIVVFPPCLLTSRLRPTFDSRPRQLSCPRRFFALRPIAALPFFRRPHLVSFLLPSILLHLFPLRLSCTRGQRVFPCLSLLALSRLFQPRTISQSLRVPLSPPTP